MSERHLNENLEKYTTDGKISAPERKVLMTKWVGDAWVNTNQDMVHRSCKKCGISLALDGSENHLLIIEKLPEYTMPEEETGEEYQLFSDEEDDEEDDEEEAETNDYDIVEEVDS